MPKIYLSPAAHGSDNPCSYSKSCGENTHANKYLDELEPYLKACGIQYKRASKANTGNKVSNTIKESNAYKPDIHYVCHTNAANGKVQGSRPHVWLKSGNGKKWAEVILKHRRQIYPYACIIKDGSALAEVNSTNSIAIYEELVFHDNVQDITWFHENMRKMAEYTCRAFCEIFGMKFVDPYYVAPKPAPAKPAPAPTPSPTLAVGDKVKIIGTPAYFNSTKKVPLFIRALTLYVWQIGNGKVLISPFKSGAVTGWVKTSDVKKA